MARSLARLSFAGLGAVALTGGLLCVDAGHAAAAEADGWKVTRTVSNTAPSPGDVITATIKFERTNAVDKYIVGVKDLHPACLTYVAGSASGMNIKSATPTPSDPQAPGMGNVAVTVTDAYVSSITGTSKSLSLKYTVGANCARDTPLDAEVHVSPSVGGGSKFGSIGPKISVQRDATTTKLAAVSGLKVGKAVTLSATVSGAQAGDSVTFYNGTTKIGTGRTNADGVATLTWTPGTSGPASLHASFPQTATAKASESAKQAVTIARGDNTGGGDAGGGDNNGGDNNGGGDNGGGDNGGGDNTGGGDNGGDTGGGNTGGNGSVGSGSLGSGSLANIFG